MTPEILSSSEPVRWLVAFVALFATDVCWALYVAKVKQGSAYAAATWAVALFLMGGIAVLGYTSNPWLLIPSAAGAFVGTLVGIWIEQRSARKGGAS